jgi:hypothetical protein
MEVMVSKRTGKNGMVVANNYKAVDPASLAHSHFAAFLLPKVTNYYFYTLV